MILEMEKIEALKFMQQSLIDQQLEIMLMPATEPKFSGHMVRTVTSKNPEWYSAMCQRYPRANGRNKFETIISRQSVVKVIAKILNGVPCSEVYRVRIDECISEVIDQLREIKKT